MIEKAKGHTDLKMKDSDLFIKPQFSAILRVVSRATAKSPAREIRVQFDVLARALRATPLRKTNEM
jgi:hypothetical protein